MVLFFCGQDDVIISLDQRHNTIEQEIRNEYQIVKDEIRNKVHIVGSSNYRALESIILNFFIITT